MSKPKKIVVIEDLDDIRKLLSIRLKAYGYQVVTAKDGQEGIEKVRKEKPDLVITDLAIPKMNGHVIVRILKGSPDFKHIPIIMLSAFVSETMKDHLQVPADAYMPKPFNPNELLRKIEELLSASEDSA